MDTSDPISKVACRSVKSWHNENWARSQPRVKSNWGRSTRCDVCSPTLIWVLHKWLLQELVNTISIIRADIHHTKDLKAKTDQAVEDTITSMRIIDAHKSQQANHTHLRDHASFPYEYAFFQNHPLLCPTSLRMCQILQATVWTDERTSCLV